MLVLNYPQESNFDLEDSPNCFVYATYLPPGKHCFIVRDSSSQDVELANDTNRERPISRLLQKPPKLPCYYYKNVLVEPSVKSVFKPNAWRPYLDNEHEATK